MLTTLLTTAVLAAQAAHPLAPFRGTWTGDMHSFGADYPTMPMSLTVEPTDTDNEMTWTIRYGDQDVRPYVIRPVEGEDGTFEIDEKNSIILPAKLFGNDSGHTLVSAFAIEPNGLVAIYRVEGDTMTFTVITLANDRATTSGGGGEVPEVLTVPARNMQHAVLKRAE